MSNAWRPSARLGAAVGLSCTLALSTLAVDLRAEGPYEPTRESLDTHPLPQWWRDAKFGIFIHWGVYAVPAYALPGLPVLGYAEWYWAMQQIPGTPTWLHHLLTYGADVVYDDFIPRFRAERWDPSEWIRLFEDAGARYFVLTSKHHDGFLLWPSETTGRDAGDLGPQRDLIGELFDDRVARAARIERGHHVARLERAAARVPEGRLAVDRHIAGVWRPTAGHTERKRLRLADPLADLPKAEPNVLEVLVVSDHVDQPELSHDDKARKIRERDSRLVAKLEPQLLCFGEALRRDRLYFHESTIDARVHRIHEPLRFEEGQAPKDESDGLVKHEVGGHDRKVSTPLVTNGSNDSRVPPIRAVGERTPAPRVDERRLHRLTP
jgi:hypothetical protein